MDKHPDQVFYMPVYRTIDSHEQWVRITIPYREPVELSWRDRMRLRISGRIYTFLYKSVHRINRLSVRLTGTQCLHEDCDDWGYEHCGDDDDGDE